MLTGSLSCLLDSAVANEMTLMIGVCFLCVFQIGEEMSQNSFIKQYLAKQQELLRQRLEREAREATEADGKQTHTNIYTQVITLTWLHHLCGHSQHKVIHNVWSLVRSFSVSNDEPAMLILMHQCLSGCTWVNLTSHTCSVLWGNARWFLVPLNSNTLCLLIRLLFFTCALLLLCTYSFHRDLDFHLSL